MKRLTHKSRTDHIKKFAKKSIDQLAKQAKEAGVEDIIADKALLEPACMAITLAARRYIHHIEEDENGKSTS